MSIYKVTMWILLFISINYLFQNSKLYEKFISRKLKHYEGNGTFPSFLFTDRSTTVDKIKLSIKEFEKRKKEIEREFRNMMKGLELEYEPANIEKNENYIILFKEYKEVVNKLNDLRKYKPENSIDYYKEFDVFEIMTKIKRLEKLLDTYNVKDRDDDDDKDMDEDTKDKFNKYKKLIKEFNKYKLTNAGIKDIINMPDGNKLPLDNPSDYRFVLNNKIDSILIDIDVGLTESEGAVELDDRFERELEKEVKKRDELNNKVFNKVLENMIDKFKANYIFDNINFDNLEIDEYRKLYKYYFEKDKKESLFKILEYDDIKESDINRLKNIENYISRNLSTNNNLSIPNNNDNFFVVDRKINYILKNTENSREYFYNCEIVLYRNTNHAKHIELDILYRNRTIYIIDAKVVGIITEDKIYLPNKLKDYIKNLLYFKYEDKHVITKNNEEELISKILDMNQAEYMWLLMKRLNALNKDRGVVDFDDYLNLMETSISNSITNIFKSDDAVCFRDCAGSYLRTYE